jgi:polyhydroxybutyrate depolymerase
MVPYDGGKIQGGDRKDRGSIIATDRAIELWLQASGCGSQPENGTLEDRDPKDQCRVHFTRWPKGPGKKAEVWLYRIEGGGHTWPSGIQYAPRFFVGRVTNDIDSQTIWDFLSSHPKQDTK